MTREQRKQLAELIVDKLTAEWREFALDGLADLVTERQRTAEPVATGGNVVPFRVVGRKTA